MWVEDFRAGAVNYWTWWAPGFCRRHEWLKWSELSEDEWSQGGQVTERLESCLGHPCGQNNPSQGWQDVWGGEKESVQVFSEGYQQENRCMASLQEPQKIRGFYLRTVEEQWPGNFIGCKVSLEGVGLGPGSLCFRRNPNSSGQHPWHIICVSKLGHENHLRVCVKNIDFRAPYWVHWIRIYRRGDWECIF